MCRKIFLALLLATFSANQITAQCLGSCSCSTANTETAGHKTTEAKGEWLITTGYSVTHYTPFSDDELIKFATDSASVYTVNSQQSFKAGLQYNLTDRLRLSAVMPYNLSYDNREGMVHTSTHTMVNDYGNVHGFGDVTVFAKYQWLKSNNWSLETGLGLKLPIGQTNTSTSTGLVAPPHLQPGTGSWDPVASLQVRRMWGRWLISEDVFGKIATTANDHNMGNYVGATTSVNYQLIRQSASKNTGLALLGGALVEYNSKMKMPVNHNHGGDPVPDQEIVPFDNSGFTRIIAISGIVISPGKHFNVPLTCSVPVFEEYNGHQVSMKWKASAGFNVSF